MYFFLNSSASLLDSKFNIFLFKLLDNGGICVGKYTVIVMSCAKGFGVLEDYLSGMLTCGMLLFLEFLSSMFLFIVSIGAIVS